jgi:hypothetical protein
MRLEAAVPPAAAVPVEQVSCWPEQEASEALDWEQAHRLVGTSPEWQREHHEVLEEARVDSQNCLRDSVGTEGSLEASFAGTPVCLQWVDDEHRRGRTCARLRHLRERFSRRIA